jgi:hypothetical protein
MEAKGSDVRLLELSLQPTKLARQAGSTTYTWAYQRLLFGQPVRADVLGIAPIDRLGELTWLGPLSVLVFGLIVGLVVRAASAPQFDLWMLLLTVGTFAGAYPLMYFAQESIALVPALLVSAGFMLVVIGVIAVALMGVWLALVGVLLPATAILAVTLTAAIWPALQGLLLTVELLGFFIGAMLLLARIRAAATASPAGGQAALAHPMRGCEACDLRIRSVALDTATELRESWNRVAEFAKSPSSWRPRPSSRGLGHPLGEYCEYCDGKWSARQRANHDENVAVDRLEPFVKPREVDTGVRFPLLLDSWHRLHPLGDGRRSSGVRAAPGRLPEGFGRVVGNKEAWRPDRLS